MAKDTVNTETETVESEKINFRTRVRNWWDDNKSRVTWFGIGTLAGAATVVGTALLLEPAEEQYEGDNEETVALDFSTEGTES